MVLERLPRFFVQVLQGQGSDLDLLFILARRTALGGLYRHKGCGKQQGEEVLK